MGLIKEDTLCFHPGVSRVQHCDWHTACAQCIFFVYMNEETAHYKWKPDFNEDINEKECNLIIPLQLKYKITLFIYF